MKLTKKQAIDLSKELWGWLAETGAVFKGDWPEWSKYGRVWARCFLCAYAKLFRDSSCKRCPYFIKFGECEGEDQPYDLWKWAETKRDRKRYAKQFLKQLEEL